MDKNTNIVKCFKLVEPNYSEQLPKLNCSNCQYYKQKLNSEILESKSNGYYAMECINFVHPIEDCVLEGFSGHSERY